MPFLVTTTGMDAIAHCAAGKHRRVADAGAARLSVLRR